MKFEKSKDSLASYIHLTFFFNNSIAVRSPMTPDPTMSTLEDGPMVMIKTNKLAVY